MSREYPQILFWKWDNSHIEKRNYREKIKDIVERSCFDYIYVGTAWCDAGLLSRQVYDSIADAVAYTHELGKKFIFEIDVRSVRDRFAEKYPKSTTAVMFQKEITLNEEGKGAALIKLEDCHDQFGTYKPVNAEIFKVYAFEKTGAFRYRKGSLKDITGSASGDMQNGVFKVHIDPGPKEGKMNALVMANVWYNLPDSASGDTIEFFDELFDMYKDIPFDGIALDEWGYVAHPHYNFSQSYKNPWYSHSIAYDIALRFKIEPSLFYLRMSYAEEGSEGQRVKYINHFYEMIREYTVGVEEYYYDKVKKVFGKEAFVGVHPTWYAINEVDNSPEVFKNGINWWDVPRDYGFTDEIMIFPVRTALAHKWKSNIWYNMWYSEFTRDKFTFARETWSNARYGGRTINLGYEIIKEFGCTQLHIPGDLEYVSDMEEKIGMLNRFQVSSINCSVLVIMGIPACCNWLDNITGNEVWNKYNSRFIEAFTCARDLWISGWNCDLVASYEIEDGDLYLDKDGKPVYGSQSYDCVVFMFPKYSKMKTLEFLSGLNKGLARAIVIGDCDTDFYGEKTAGFKNIIEGADLYFEERPQIEDITGRLKEWGISENRVPYGSVYQDGSVIMTWSGAKSSTGHILETAFMCNGHKVSFKAEDMMAIRLDCTGGIDRLAASKLEYLYIDGVQIYKFDEPKDMLVL